MQEDTSILLSIMYGVDCLLFGSGAADQALSLWFLFVQPVTSGSPLYVDALCILCSTTDDLFTLFQTYQTMLLVLTPTYRKTTLFIFLYLYLILILSFISVTFILILFKRTAFLDAFVF